jgi:hypothetical protein
MVPTRPSRPRPTDTRDPSWRVPPPGGEPRCFTRLAPGAQAAADARGRVAAVIRNWDIRVDVDAALLITSELVTNAVLHGGGPVMMTVRSSAGHLRVDVHDASPIMPVPPAAVDFAGDSAVDDDADADEAGAVGRVADDPDDDTNESGTGSGGPGPGGSDDDDDFLACEALAIDEIGAETGRGLVLVDALSTGWGCYRTPTGKAVYFILSSVPAAESAALSGPDGLTH